MSITKFLRLTYYCLMVVSSANAFADEPATTRIFRIENDRAFLGDEQIKLWGIRCGNALHNPAITQRHINNLDNMAAHGINCVGVYIQGSNAGWPDADAALNGFTRDGKLKPIVAERLEALIRAADQRGMVIMVGLCSPRKDQDFYDEDAIRRAIQAAATFLRDRKLRNVFVDIMHEYNHPERIDHPIFREPNGETKKKQLTEWFKEIAPNIAVGICPTAKSETLDSYPGMDFRIIQKEMSIPAEGFVMNVETQRQDAYQNDGIFSESQITAILDNCRRYQAAPNAGMLFHAGYIQGISNFSGSAPHAEMGGYGKESNDRGVRFYYEWVRDNVGRWEYPRHIKP